MVFVVITMSLDHQVPHLALLCIEIFQIFHNNSSNVADRMIEVEKQLGLVSVSRRKTLAHLTEVEESLEVERKVCSTYKCFSPVMGGVR